ncbi:MAG: DUF192 domain-containing protein [Candidatus Daviesbacteria bacterium]
MKQFFIQFAILTTIILGALYIAFNQSVIEPFLPINKTFTQTQIKINNTTVKIEVADTASKRSQGLSGRESMASDSGMLFIFESSKKYQFWMKGMKFPLDMIFIKDGKVVDVLKNVPPPSQGQKDDTLPIYQPVSEIDMMLETSSSFTDTNNIKVGDTVFLISQ